MLYIYRVLAYLFLPITLLGLLFRGFRNARYWQRMPERLAIYRQQTRPVDIILHAVSVGEARAAAPLVEAILAKQPHTQILLTTTTPTGSDMARTMLADKYPQQVQHVYLPYDVGIFMNRLFKVFKPKQLVVMETELWPNLIRCAKLNNVGVLYLNVRLSERSFNSYKRVKRLVSKVLCMVDEFAAQGDMDAKRLASLGVDPDTIAVIGSIKFDMTIPDEAKQKSSLIRSQLHGESGQRLVWIAASTRDREEQYVLDAFSALRKEFDNLLLVLVPRHPERFDEVFELINARELKAQRRTDLGEQRIDADTQVYLADTMGELLALYLASDVAYVGGSLVPLGGQNILEPCAVGIPVVFGTHMFNFPEISKLALQNQAGFQVNSVEQLIERLSLLLKDQPLRDEMGKNGSRFVQQNRGALQKALALLKL